MRDAAEEVIQVLKDGSLRDPERHDQISRLLTGKGAGTARGANGGLAPERYAEFVRLGKRLDDYDEITKQGDTGGDSGDANDDDRKGERVDDEMGVAVVFDDSDDEDDPNRPEGASDIEDGVVIDASSSDSEDSDDENNGNGEMNDDDEQPRQRRRNKKGDDNDDTNVDDNNDEEKLIQGGDDGNKKKRRGQERVLSVHEIDAHFLQRQLSRHIDDAAESAKMASEVLDVLNILNHTDVRECENKLLFLLRFDMFDTIKLLLRNRVKVWACVSMKRAQTEEERNSIEKSLMEEPTGEGKLVWNEMHSKSRAEDWSRERMKGLTDTLKGGDPSTDTKDVSKALDSINVKTEDTISSNKMDVDGDGNIKKEDVVELDLEQLVFREGSHTMSNKKCDLPDASWRAMKKGYEEVHVPAVKAIIPEGEELIKISDLPKWTHSAFKGMDKLNRIQSKLYDVALKSSENILLCAPTGAGKTNVACLTMLNILGQFKKEDESFDLNSFKIVYVAQRRRSIDGHKGCLKGFGFNQCQDRRYHLIQ